MSFDIRRFLIENKLTKASKAIVNENTPGFNPFMDAVDDYISMDHPRYEELQRAVEDALHSGELYSRPYEPGSYYEQVAQIAKELGIEDSDQDDFVHTMPGYKDVMDALDNITIRESQHPQEIETEGGLLGILIGDVNGTPIYSVEDSSVRDTMVYVVGGETVAIEVDGEMVPGAIIYAEYGQTEEVSEFLAHDIANELGVEYQSYPYGDINHSMDDKVQSVDEEYPSFSDPLKGFPQAYKDLLKKLQRSNDRSERSMLIDKMNVIRKKLNLKPLTK